MDEEPKRTGLFEKFLEASGWKASEANQNIPGYFPDKPGGSRCLWSVRWSSGLSKHITEPGDMMPLQNMSLQQQVIELADYKNRGSDAAGRVLSDAALGDKTLFRAGALVVISDERKFVKEYIFQPNKPRFLKWDIKRPGWGVHDG
jgi:hypothetical protein